MSVNGGKHNFNKKKKLFKFETSWTKEAECEKIIEMEWTYDDFLPNSLERVQAYLNQCSGALTRRSRKKVKVSEKEIRDKSDNLRKGLHNVDVIKRSQSEFEILLELEDIK